MSKLPEMMERWSDRRVSGTVQNVPPHVMVLDDLTLLGQHSRKNVIGASQPNTGIHHRGTIEASSVSI